MKLMMRYRHSTKMTKWTKIVTINKIVNKIDQIDRELFDLHFPRPRSNKGLTAVKAATAVPSTLPAVPMPDPKAWVPTVNNPKVLPCL